MKKIIVGAIAMFFAMVPLANADQALIIDAGYSTVTQNVRGRLEAAGHTVTVTSDVSTIPTGTGAYQQVWDLRYSAALTSGEQTNYQSFITNGGFAYFVTENPGCCMNRNNSVAALVTALGGGSTQIGPGWANNIETNMNTTYMTNGITVNYAAVAAIVNSQGIPLISDGSGAVSGMSWIGRAGALGQGVTGTIVTVADTNWLDQSRFNISGTTAQQQNVTALDDIIRGIVAGTVGGTISANGNGAAASNGGSGGGSPPPPTIVSSAPGAPIISTSVSYGNSIISNVITDSRANVGKNITITRTTTPYTTSHWTSTTITTPTTVDTYSDGSTITTNGTPTTTTTNGDIIQVGQSTSESAQISAIGLNELTKFKSFNPFSVDVLSTKDGGWITPSASYYKSTGSLRTGGIDFGFHKTIDNNTFGIAFRMDGSNAGGYLNSKVETSSYTGTMYALTKQNYGWWKLSAGVNRNDYSSTVSIPQFGLINGTKMNQTNYYADIGAYSPITIIGIRPLAGVVINNSVISDIRETGSPLLSTAPNVGSTITANPYFGGRYEFNKSVYFESKLIYDKEYKVVSSNRLGVKTDIYKNMSLELGAGLDKGSEYTGIIGTAGVKWKF
jgi:hypothetical protein